MTLDQLVVRPKNREPYPYLVGSGLLDQPDSWLPPTPGGLVLIVDPRVDELHGDRLVPHLETRSPFLKLVIPEGEAGKCRAVKADLEDRMLDEGFGRDTVVAAFGGGVTTDLAGFVAATYMRGVDTLLLPTTLLAMVDASLGGKTGINASRGKNLIGAFHHPRVVAADVDLLDTLPEEELLCGLAEAAKAAIIGDGRFFRELATGGGPSAIRDSKTLAESLVLRAAAVKIRVVEEDPGEAGLRHVLNFGHTLGHAFEKVTGFAIGHGRAVTAGMHVESRLAEGAGILPPGEGRALRDGLTRMGLPFSPPVTGRIDELLEAMTLDKKNRGGRVRFSLPEGIGEMYEGDGGSYTTTLDTDLVRRVLEETCP